MAGISLGTSVPASLPSRAASQRPLIRVPAASRTRRNHGVFLVGDELATVYSSRREADALGVTVAIGGGALVLTGGMTPSQARAMARALVAAAAAVETVAQGTARQQGGAA